MRSEHPLPARNGRRTVAEPVRRLPRTVVQRVVWAVVAVLVLAACGPPSGGDVEPDAARTDVTPADGGETSPAEVEERVVRVVNPEVGTLTATRSASATIRAVRDASVAANASGRVVEILARPGDEVAAGTTVVRLDDTQPALQLRSAELGVRQAEVDLQGARSASDEGAGQAQASLRAAESNVAALRDQVEDLRALVEAGGAARSELRALDVQLEQAEAQAGEARDAVARSGRSGSEDLALLELRVESARVQAEQARDQLAQTRITAPFDGEIVELHLETGEFAAAGNPVFRIQSTDEREAVVDVPPEDALRLQEQGAVTLRYAGRDLPARIVAAARPSDQPRSVRLIARLEGDVGNLPNGSLADLRYTVDVATGTLLPSGAISAEAGGTYTYVVRGGVATRVDVDVLGEAAATAAVTGVGPEDDVISPRPLDVREGTPVRIAGG